MRLIFSFLTIRSGGEGVVTNLGSDLAWLRGVEVASFYRQIIGLGCYLFDPDFCPMIGCGQDSNQHIGQGCRSIAALWLIKPV
ncbi:MAG: hypothetical protein A4E19_12160 [Nitrospira sp. SG-bin1]|nr:MAG: hypothetical protein A4E19_12160 [Nitrospira sp. SG-bin1]